MQDRAKANHDLDKGTVVNHDLARLTMIMASVPWLRVLGTHCFGQMYVDIELPMSQQLQQSQSELTTRSEMRGTESVI